MLAVSGSQLQIPPITSLLQRGFWRWLEAVPLLVFLILMALANPQAMGEWAPVYSASAVAVLFIVGIFRFVKKPLNPIFIGINCYVLSGWFGLLIDWQGFNRFYGDVKAAGMLFWVTGVGILFTLFTHRGFVGIANFSPIVCRQYSMVLIVVSSLAAIWSYFFRDVTFVSDFIPFVFLFAAQSVLRGKLSSVETQN